VNEACDVAVVGMGLVLPGASSPAEFWSLLSGDQVVYSGQHDAIGFADFTGESDVSSATGQYGALPGFAAHPRLRHESAAGTAPVSLSTRWLRHSLLQALDTATVRPRDRCLFAAGIGAGAMLNLEEALVAASAARQLAGLAFGADPNGPRRVREALAHRYPHAGPRPERFLPHTVIRDSADDVLPDGTELVVLDSACSAGVFAVDAAVRALLLDDADVAFCGGVSATTATEYVTMSRLRVVSSSGEVRPFDHAGTGTLFTDGAAVLALKRFDRAEADGDEVLAVLAGVGTSSDGRGKALFAPDANGQRQAILRARDRAGVGSADVGWLVSHAIGIPAGDAVEFAAMDSVTDASDTCHVTSYKSVTGHPSYPSGVLGIITAALGMRHGVIPAQRLFEKPPETYPAGDSGLRISTEDVAFSGNGTRVVGVSCYGFGGGNGHVVVTDRRAGSQGTRRHERGEVVLVGWGAHLPGVPAPDRLSALLHDGGLDLPAVFDTPYPVPSPAAVGIPPSTLRRVGRCQPMILHAVNALADTHGRPWRELNAHTGVLTGLFGPPDAAMTYPQRIHLRAVRRALTDDRLLAVYDQYEKGVRTLVPEVTEDAVTAVLGNCVAARVSKRFDLHGPNMVVDDGVDSTLTALRLAMRALHSGDLDLALVCGISGNPHPELLDLVRALDNRVTEIAEGAFAFAVTTADLATAHDLPVLARLSSWSPNDRKPEAVVDTGPVHGRSYLAADSALAILAAVTHPTGDVVVTGYGGELGSAVPHSIRILTP
jgi:3-oxoacyl-(acyl-carrier-protein) synthase